MLRGLYGKVIPMAQREVIVMIDDLDFTEGPEVETVDFALQGRTYSIDLSPANVAKLETALAPFIDAGTQTGGKRKYRRKEAAADAAPASV